MKEPVLWVVEMLSDISRKYEPTVGVSLNRAEGRDNLKTWRFHHSADSFRLTKYAALKERMK